MINLIQLLTEAKENFETFAKNRLAGAEKIIANAKEKGGDALLTYTHFNVKPSYYKKAIKGNFDKEAVKDTLKRALELYRSTLNERKLK